MAVPVASRLRGLLPLLLTLPLAGQVPAGSWTLAAAPDLTAVIERATASMNFLTRPIARSRLKKTNEVHPRLRIEHPGSEITIQYDDLQPQHMPADGSPVPWKREDGEAFVISARTGPEGLVQTYKAEDGERSNAFRVDPATGLLTVTVTVRSGRLPGPVVYSLSYRPSSP